MTDTEKTFLFSILAILLVLVIRVFLDMGRLDAMVRELKQRLDDLDRKVPFAVLCATAVAAPALASPARAVAAAVADCRELTPEIACRTRYLYRPQNLAVLQWWCNSLSREVEFGKLRSVRPDLVAVILDEYQWSDTVWEAQIETEPFFYYHLRDYHDGKWCLTVPGRELVKRTHSRVPLVFADWWLFYASRQIDLNNKEHGHGYYDWLGIRDQKAFEALRPVDRQLVIKIGDELRGVIEAARSGVALEGVERQIEWRSTYGDGEQGLWLTLDSSNSAGDNSAAGNLKEGEFRFNATEAFTGLPNRLWAVGAFNDRGVRQATVPPEIASDKSPYHRGNDQRIHPFSCFHCHDNGGLKPVDDWARNRGLRSPSQLDTFKIEDYKRLSRQYFRSLDVQLAKGRSRYTEALKECCGLKPEQAAAQHASLYYGYLRQRTTADVAILLGVTEECLVLELERFFDKDNVKAVVDKKRLAIFLNLIAKEPQPVPIISVESFFADLTCIVRQHK